MIKFDGGFFTSYALLILFSISMTLLNSIIVQLTDFLVPLTPVYHVLRVSSIIWTGVMCCVDVSVQKGMLYSLYRSADNRL